MRKNYLPRWVALCIGVLGMMAGGQDPLPTEKDLPRVILTRIFEEGNSESLTLRCKEESDRQLEFLCDVVRFRNGIVVNAIKLSPKQAKAILSGFFQILPASELKLAENPEGNRPSYVWDVTYHHQTTKGYLLRKEKDRNKKMMRAILSLEGALASEFYR